jgi:hypothetical protein
MTDIPPPQMDTIQSMMELCKNLKKPDRIETTMLKIIKELGGLADYILNVWNGSGQQEPLTNNRRDFLHTGNIFLHLMELMIQRNVHYTPKVHDLIFTHIDNPYRYKEGHEIPITIHFNSITRSITTFDWKNAKEHDLDYATNIIIVSLWNIGRSLNFNPEDALIHVCYNSITKTENIPEETLGPIE